MVQSEKTFIVTGYVPKRSVKKLEDNFLTSRFDLSFETEDVPRRMQEAPVLLSNGHFASAADGITASFGLPAKERLIRRRSCSACYVFLFGLMLSDAAYGLIVFLACFIAIKKFPMNGRKPESLRLFMYCGLSTLVWGVLFGGYFGDAVDVVSKDLLSAGRFRSRRCGLCR